MRAWGVLKAMTFLLIKHIGETPADDMAPQIIPECKNFTLGLKQLGFCTSTPFFQDFQIEAISLHLERPLRTVQFFFSFFPQVRLFWYCFRIRICFDKEEFNHFLKTSVHHGSWCTDTSFSCLQGSELFCCVLLSTTLFPCSQLSTCLQTVNLFSCDPLCLNSLCGEFLTTW